MGYSIFGRHPLTVYRISKPDQTVLPVGGDEPVYDLLRGAAFISIANTAEPRGVGFVTLENHRSTNFGPGSVNFGPYYAWAIRIDERKIPPAALEEAVQERIESEIEERRTAGTLLEGQSLSTDRKREIRAQCKLRLLPSIPPTPKVVDVVWNHESGLLYLCDKSPGTQDAFEKAFRRVSLTGYEIELFTPQDVIPGLDLAELMGGGFLTWLYGRREDSRGYTFGEITLLAGIEDRVEIGADGETVKAVAKSDDFPEIDAGLRVGKRVTRADLRLESGTRVFTLDVSGVLFPLNSVDGPDVVFPADPEELPGAVIDAADNIETSVRLLCALVGCWAAEKHGAEAFISTPDIMRHMKNCRAAILSLGKTAERVTVSFGGKEIVLVDNMKGKAAA